MENLVGFLAGISSIPWIPVTFHSFLDLLIFFISSRNRYQPTGTRSWLGLVNRSLTVSVALPVALPIAFPRLRFRFRFCRYWLRPRRRARHNRLILPAGIILLPRLSLWRSRQDRRLILSLLRQVTHRTTNHVCTCPAPNLAESPGRCRPIRGLFGEGLFQRLEGPSHLPRTRAAREAAQQTFPLGRRSTTAWG